MHHGSITRRHFLIIAAALLFVLCMFDVATSYINISAGGIELNPFMAPYTGKIADFTIIKCIYIAGVVAVGSGMMAWLPDLPIGEVWVGTHVTLHACVVGHNLSIVAHYGLLGL
ncbi:MAG: hypothetical protein APR53_08845 [Methanoculleus sp. SDB]|nr:MAG: hypothetical protein APR53_08845 [Methanoculleus sp. SDB]